MDDLLQRLQYTNAAATLMRSQLAARRSAESAGAVIGSDALEAARKDAEESVSRARYGRWSLIALASTWAAGGVASIVKALGLRLPAELFEQTLALRTRAVKVAALGCSLADGRKKRESERLISKFFSAGTPGATGYDLTNVFALRKRLGDAAVDALMADPVLLCESPQQARKRRVDDVYESRGRRGSGRGSDSSCGSAAEVVSMFEVAQTMLRMAGAPSCSGTKEAATAAAAGAAEAAVSPVAAAEACGVGVAVAGDRARRSARAIKPSVLLQRKDEAAAAVCVVAPKRTSPAKKRRVESPAPAPAPPAAAEAAAAEVEAEVVLTAVPPKLAPISVRRRAKSPQSPQSELERPSTANESAAEKTPSGRQTGGAAGSAAGSPTAAACSPTRSCKDLDMAALAAATVATAAAAIAAAVSPDSGGLKRGPATRGRSPLSVQSGGIAKKRTSVPSRQPSQALAAIVSAAPKQQQQQQPAGGVTTRRRGVHVPRWQL